MRILSAFHDKVFIYHFDTAPTRLLLWYCQYQTHTEFNLAHPQQLTDQTARA